MDCFCFPVFLYGHFQSGRRAFEKDVKCCFHFLSWPVMQLMLQDNLNSIKSDLTDGLSARA